MPAQPDEVRALGRVAGDAADRLATTPAQSLHAAIADRVFTNLGPAALPARALHDGISTAIYAGLRVGISTGAKSAALVAKARGAHPDAISRHPQGARAIGIANGLIGHELALEDDPLAVQLGLWHEGEPLPVTTERLDEAFPDHTGNIVVFVHGLFETERSWTFGDDEPYGARLRRDAGWTPLHVRYNSGLPIAENGRKLSWLLEDVVANWPQPVDRIALVGHSMGGMVARCAGKEAEGDGAAWRKHVTHLACLGSPHQGAPIEQGITHLVRFLNKLPEAAPIAQILDQRSQGVRDLCKGIDGGPLLEDVHHLFVGATITADPEHPVGLVLGDLLVRGSSSAGPADCEIDVEDVVSLGGLNHFALLNHRKVFEHLERFLQRDRARLSLPAG